MQHATEATAKAVVAGGGVGVAVSDPSDYVSYFDRIYDFYFFQINGDDFARIVGMVVGIVVGLNIIYNIVKDIYERNEKKRNQNAKDDQ